MLDTLINWVGSNLGKLALLVSLSWLVWSWINKLRGKKEEPVHKVSKEHWTKWPVTWYITAWIGFALAFPYMVGCLVFGSFCGFLALHVFTKQLSNTAPEKVNSFRVVMIVVAAVFWSFYGASVMFYPLYPPLFDTLRTYGKEQYCQIRGIPYEPEEKTELASVSLLLEQREKKILVNLPAGEWVAVRDLVPNNRTVIETVLVAPELLPPSTEEQTSQLGRAVYIKTRLGLAREVDNFLYPPGDTKCKQWALINLFSQGNGTRAAFCLHSNVACTVKLCVYERPAGYTM